MVRQRLRAAGQTVYTPTLTGLGERRHLAEPGVDLSTHIQDIANVIEWEELNDVILVGHSYAGWVIAGVADRLKERLAHVVYLDAAIPVDGRAFNHGIPAEAQAAAEASAIDGFLLAPQSTEWLGIPPENEEMTAWVAKHLTPHPMATLSEPISLPNGGSEGLPNSFVLCTAGASAANFARHAEAARARGWPITELDTGHDAMVTAPDQVTEFLLTLV